MAVRPLVEYQNPVLHQKAKRITRFDGSLQTLIDDMAETMRAEHGVGLAGPQIGVPLRVCTIEIPEDHEDEPLAGQLIVLVNPEIVKGSEPVEVEEGCLSLPGYVGDVTRFRHVTVKGRDRHGKEVRYKGSDLLAQAFQHEIDHLDGILYVDRLENRDKLRRADRRADGSEEGEAPVEGPVAEGSATEPAAAERGPERPAATVVEAPDVEAKQQGGQQARRG